LSSGTASVRISGAENGIPDRLRVSRGEEGLLIPIADIGASFDREAGATCGGWTRFRKPGAYNHTTRHPVECAE
jgi:hypothetical protein